MIWLVTPTVTMATAANVITAQITNDLAFR